MNCNSFTPRPQVSSAHYRPSHYLTPARMASIGHQVQLTTRHFPGAVVLEIGGGSGLARHLLREEGFRVISLDLDPALSPEVVAALPHLPFRTDAVDAVLCCQVLEHLPFEDAKRALKELRRVSKQGAVISVPTVLPRLSIALLSSKHNGSRSFRLPQFGKGRIRSHREHYWEIGANIRLSDFERAIHDAGFRVIESFRPFRYLFHHFFVLS